MTVTPTVYNIRKSLEGNLLGLDGSLRNTLALGGATSPVGEYAPYLMGRDLMGLRLFYPGKFGLQGNDYKECVRITHNDLYDDFLGIAIDATKWHALAGSGGSPVAPAIHVANNGILRLTSGSDATATMATNGSQVTSALTNLVSDGALRFETRLGNLSAATSQSICFGLVDASTLTAPFTLATATYTGNGTNGAAFLQDAAGTNTGLSAVAINAGGAVQHVALSAYSVNTTANAYDIYRIEIDAAGNATFFIDGVLVATILLAVATTAVLCPSVGMFAEAASAQTLDVDYILTQSYRV